VGDEHRLLGRGLAGSSKIARVGPEQARAALKQAISGACEEARINTSQLQRIAMGIAGAARANIVNSTRKLMEEIISCPIEIMGDMVIAQEAAFAGGPGIIVIAGTGSICYGRDARGETARAGGWGQTVSDEGSGDWIGRRAVALALRAHDAGQHTALLPAVFSAWRVGTRDDVCTIANSYPAPDFSQLFPKVVEVARAGDAIASRILEEAGAELAELAKIVAGRLWPGSQSAAVRLTGGVFQNSEQVRDAFTRKLKEARAKADVSYSEAEPVVGALALARKKPAAEIASSKP
jgi:N-acetylglucosamine kinase-like BadF-type ATPase